MSEIIPEFGIKRDNEERRDGGCGVVFDPETGLFAVGRVESTGLLILFSGGVEDGEDMQEGILREVREESGLHDFKHVEKVGEALTHYYNSSKKVNRVAHARCFLVVLNSRAHVPTKLEAHEDFTLHWKEADDVLAHWRERNRDEDYSHWIYFLDTAIQRLRDLGHIQS